MHASHLAMQVQLWFIAAYLILEDIKPIIDEWIPWVVGVMAMFIFFACVFRLSRPTPPVAKPACCQGACVCHVSEYGICKLCQKWASIHAHEPDSEGLL